MDGDLDASVCRAPGSRYQGAGEKVKASWREKESQHEPTKPSFHALAAAIFLAIHPHSPRASSRMDSCPGLLEDLASHCSFWGPPVHQLTA